MKITVNDEIGGIFREIYAEQKSINEWALIESGDMLQSKNFCGGFDADENAFCFSYYDNEKEHWFSFTLEDVFNFVEKKFLDLEIDGIEAN